MTKKQKKMLIRIIVSAVLMIGLAFLPIDGLPRFFLYLIPYLIIGYDILIKAGKGILNRQVFEITDGAIAPKALQTILSIGVAISVGLAMMRILTHISILWVLVPGYALALLLTFFCPDIFTSIAFDSGGVASGPMTATFLLPFAVGACSAVGGNVVQDAFGVVAMVAMTPLIAIQILGLIYKLRSRKKVEDEDVGEQEPLALSSETESSEDIIEL